MTYRVYTSLLFSFLFLQIVHGQSGLADQVQEMASGLETIETGKATIRQSISLEEKPYMMEFVRETEDMKKGNVNTEVYQLNLALLDGRTIKRNTKKDEMSVVISSANGKLIRYTKNDDDAKYTSDLKIICPDIDEAREVEKQLKDILNAAGKAWKNDINIPSGLTALKNECKEISGRFQYGDEEIDQRFVDIEGYPDYFSMKQIFSKGGKDELNSYEFNISDLDKNSFKISNEKELIGLSFRTTAKNNFIQHQTDEKIKYKSEIKFYYSSPSEAMVAKELWVKGIELAKAETEKRHKSMTDCSDCHATLYELLAASSKRLDPLEGQGKCKAVINQTDLDKGDDKRFEFHWGDIDGKKVELDYGSGYQKIELQAVFKQKYFAVYDNEGIEKYDYGLKLAIQDVDNAKICKKLIDKIIADCEYNLEAKTAEWVADNITTTEIIGRFTQSFAKGEDDCSYNYSIYDNEKGEQQEYEFNLYDLNEKAMEVKISGNEIAIRIPTVRNEKVITRYDAKGELKYEKGLEILFGDLETARTTELTLKDMIAKCK